MSKQDTIISLLKEIDKNIDNVGSGGSGGSKIKIAQPVISQNCIIDGIWDSSCIDWNYVTSLQNLFHKLIIDYIDVSTWDVSNVTSLTNTFGVSVDSNKTIIVGINNWNITNKLISMSGFCGTFALSLPVLELDLRHWDVSNVVDMNRAFAAYNIGSINIEGWDTSKVSNFEQFMYQPVYSRLLYANFVGISGVSAKNLTLFIQSDRVTTLVGDYTIEDVIENNLYILKDVKVSYPINAPLVNRASLRACINGLADLTGQTAKTLTLNTKLIPKLTEEDIAIATAKNWTIA